MRGSFIVTFGSLVLSGCTVGPVELARLVESGNQEVLFVVQPRSGPSPFGPSQEQVVSTYALGSGLRIGQLNLGKDTNLRCDTATPGRMWCAGNEGDVWLFQATPLSLMVTTRSIVRQHPQIGTIARASYIDPISKALVVESSEGFSWSIDADSYAATKLPVDATEPAWSSSLSGSTRLSQQPAWCVSRDAIHIGKSVYRLKGSPRSVLFQDDVEIPHTESFHQGQFVVDECAPIDFSDGSMLVTDEGPDPYRGSVVRIGGDGHIVWRSGPLENPYGFQAAHRIGEHFVLVLRTEMLSLAVSSGRIEWRRSMSY